MYVLTGASTWTLPRSINRMMAGVVAITFVSDAASKIVFSVIHSSGEITIRLP